MWYSPIWAGAGILLVLFAIYDFYVTTVTVNGSGPLSQRLARGLWLFALSWHRRKSAHGLLRAAGPIILLTLIGVWFALGWLGWLLIFCGSETAVVNAQNGVPATLVERAFYAGYSLTTIGYGNFRAPNSAGQFGSILAGLNGLFLVTLAITYSLPVISAAVEKRMLAIQIYAVGKHTPAIVDLGEEDESFSFLTAQLEQITTSIAGLSQKHLAYPVLHYFHSDQSAAALPINLARLDDALTLILLTVPDLPATSRMQMQAAQQVINNLLETLHSDFIGSPEQTPRAPDCSQIKLLRRLAIAPRDAKHAVEANSHRPLLKAFVENDGWQWNDVHELPK